MDRALIRSQRMRTETVCKQHGKGNPFPPIPIPSVRLGSEPTEPNMKGWACSLLREVSGKLPQSIPPS